MWDLKSQSIVTKPISGTSLFNERRFASSMVSNWAAFVVTGLVGFFMAPYLVSRLSAGGYGTWLLVNQVVGYLGLLDFGLRLALARQVAHLDASQRCSEIRPIVLSALALALPSAALASGVSLVLGAHARQFFVLSDEQQAVVGPLILIMGLATSTTIVSSVLAGVLIAQHRFLLLNTVDGGVLAARTIALVVALENGCGLIAVAGVSAVAGAAGAIATAVAAWRTLPPSPSHLSGVRTRCLQLLGYGLPMLVLTLAVRLVYYTDSLVIGIFHPTGAVTAYALGLMPVEYLRQIVAGATNVLGPWACRLDAQRNRGALLEMLLTATRLCLLATCPLLLMLIVTGDWLLTAWIGPHIAAQSSPVLAILAVPQLLALSMLPAAVVANAMARHRAVAAVAFGEAVLNVGFSLWLVRPLGITGVALGTAIPSLLSHTLFWPWHLKRVLSLPVRAYVASAFLPLAVPAVTMFAGLLALRTFVPPATFGVRVGALVVLMLTYFLLAWRLSLRDSERAMLLNVLTRTLRPVAIPQ